MLIGTVHVHLMSLSHKLDIEETLTVTNYQGKENGGALSEGFTKFFTMFENSQQLGAPSACVGFINFCLY